MPQAQRYGLLKRSQHLSLDASLSVATLILELGFIYQIWVINGWVKLKTFQSLMLCLHPMSHSTHKGHINYC